MKDKRQPLRVVLPHQDKLANARLSSAFTGEMATIEVGTGENKRTFYAHRDLLSFYSGYFKAVFNGGFAAAQSSVIKLEIEGSEPQALEGAARTIERHRPKLAVSVYHMADHLHRLPQQVLDFDQGYRLFLRQHNPAVPDATVCYCA